MFGKLGDIMGKLGELKKKSEEIKRSLDSRMIQTTEHGISIEINGNRKISKLSIPEELKSSPDLGQKLMEALNKAIGEAGEINEEEMKKVAGSLLSGLNLG
jgi:DNA-binding protein YbaB